MRLCGDNTADPRERRKCICGLSSRVECVGGTSGNLYCRSRTASSAIDAFGGVYWTGWLKLEETRHYVNLRVCSFTSLVPHCCGVASHSSTSICHRMGTPELILQGCRLIDPTLWAWVGSLSQTVEIWDCHRLKNLIRLQWWAAWLQHLTANWHNIITADGGEEVSLVSLDLCVHFIFPLTFSFPFSLDLNIHAVS